MSADKSEKTQHRHEEELAYYRKQEAEKLRRDHDRKRNLISLHISLF